MKIEGVPDVVYIRRVNILTPIGQLRPEARKAIADWLEKDSTPLFAVELIPRRWSTLYAVEGRRRARIKGSDQIIALDRPVD